MAKSYLLLAMTALVLILLFSVLGLHIEILIRNDFHAQQGQFAFPTILLPVALIKKGAISIGLIVAAATGVGLTNVVMKKLYAKRLGWITEEQCDKALGVKRFVVACGDLLALFGNNSDRLNPVESVLQHKANVLLQRREQFVRDKGVGGASTQIEEE